jgi:hypothetical protein
MKNTNLLTACEQLAGTVLIAFRGRVLEGEGIHFPANKTPQKFPQTFFG